MSQRSQKVLLLRRSPSLALRRQVAGCYIVWTVCAFLGGLVLAAGAFLSFLALCDCLGITDPAGNSDALLVLAAFEIGVLSIYGVLVVRIGKAQINKVLHNLPSYWRDLGARR